MQHLGKEVINIALLHIIRFSEFGFRTDLLELSSIPLSFVLGQHTHPRSFWNVILVYLLFYFCYKAAFVVVMVHLGKRQRLHETQRNSPMCLLHVIYADRTECFGRGSALIIDMNDCMMSTIYAD